MSGGDGLPPPDLGGLQINPPPNPGTGSASANLLDAARGDAGSTGKPRGRPRGSTNSPRAVTSSIPPLPPELFAKLYSPKLWARVLCAPADAMLVSTGSKTWEVSENEKEMLGETGAIAAQCFAVTDPRYLALSLAFIAVVDVYAMRFAMWRAEEKAKKEAAKK